MSGLVITVHGTPAPQGSKRHVGRGIMVESSKAVKPWREAVKWAALEQLDGEALERTGPLFADAVILRVEFVMPRPKAHYRTGKHAHELRPDAPHLVARKPDVDKLLRSTLDALGEAGVWRDDAQVASVSARKVYLDNGTGPVGARITIREARP